MKRAWLLGVVVLASGCAGALRGSRGGRDSDAGQGWLALADGKPAEAAASFNRALERDPSDARARFGAATLAYERGEVDAALAHALDLVGAASRGQDPTALALSAAALSRLPRLLSEAVDRQSVEDRLLAIAPGRLPWQAQYALALIAIDIARKRADAALLAEVSRRAGCADAIAFVGEGGRLPLLDLPAETFVSAQSPRPLLAAGCQHQLHTPDGQPGVKILRSDFNLPAGAHDIVLDFLGPARLRVDGGPWHQHGGSPTAYGPRWSAKRIDLPPGKHSVEIRAGVYGSSADLALLAIRSASAPSCAKPDDMKGDAVMMELAGALTANLAGDTDAVLAGIERLAARPRFALGLAAAGRLGEMDPTRPPDVMRDKARALWRQALAGDSSLARVWLDLATLEMQNERPREAAEHARRAQQAAPGWWPAHLAVEAAARAQGLEQPADAALAQAVALVEPGHGGCQALDRGFQRMQERHELAVAGRLLDALGRCDAQNPQPRLWAQERGDLDKALAHLQRALATSAEPTWLRTELAELRLARGETAAARAELAALVELVPRDTRARIRLADADNVLGFREQARATLAEALRRFPGGQDVRQAARLAGLALPLDEYRLDGAKVVRDFQTSGRSYQAPAVVVLDRAVERVFPDGTRLMLTHSITQVLSKDAIEHVGEVRVPAGAEILALRTRKADGTLREAEEIAGKSTFSAPNLGVGDFVESETLEVKEPRGALAPGFIGERFFFQSFDAPLDRSEYVFIAPASLRLDVNRRAGAPLPVETRGPDGARVLTFVVGEKPQLFPERSAVPAQEWVPSVRVASGVTRLHWSRFVADRMARIVRGSPEIRRTAARIAKEAGGDRGRFPEAIVSWVREHIEPEADYSEAATITLARSRGNRAGLIMALARSLGVPADLVLARSLLLAEASAPIVLSEIDEFRDALVRFPSTGGDRFVDPLVRRAPFGYLYPGLDGAPAVVVGADAMVKTVSSVKDSRSVSLRARLSSDGAAQVEVNEQLAGWPAVEWVELLDRVGRDQTKLRREFEQNWLGHHFPGAQLETLSVAAGDGSTGARVHYTFKAARMAARQGDVLRLRPMFFQSKPGRRFGTEPQRKTTLLLGHNVALDLDAEFALPGGAKVLDVGQGGVVNEGEARFSESRQVGTGDDGMPRIRLRRQARIPIMRVLPADYEGFAAMLRTVDPIEQGEIRIAVPAE
jgi:cellulose synthase operon protein C